MAVISVTAFFFLTLKNYIMICIIPFIISSIIILIFFKQRFERLMLFLYLVIFLYICIIITIKF